MLRASGATFGAIGTLRASTATLGAFDAPTGACRSAHPTAAPDGTSAFLDWRPALWSSRAATGLSSTAALSAADVSETALAGPGLQAHFHQGLSGTTSQAFTTPWRGLEDQRSCASKPSSKTAVEAAETTPMGSRMPFTPSAAFARG